MSQQQHESQLLMVREDLSALPEMTLPEGYRLRSLQPGDEEAWERIITASFGGEHSFANHMAADEPYKPERVWFIADRDGRPVATAAAWYRSRWPENTGYLHMVGLLPEHGGKKLGYYASLAALQQMAREGRTRSVLNTDDFRIPAVKIYLALGYVPVIADDSHLDRWRALAGILGRDITVLRGEDGDKLLIEAGGGTA